MPGETVRGFLARRTGVDRRRRPRSTSATAALAEGAPGADDAYAAALERWLDLGGADLEERTEEVAADLGLPVDLLDAADDRAVGRAGRAGQPRVAAARAASTSSCSTSPPTTSTSPGSSASSATSASLRAGTVVVSHDREFLARTVTSVLELDLAQQQIDALRRRLRRLPRRARDRPPARPRGLRGVRRQARRADRARMQTQKQWVDKGVRNARKKATDGDKHVKHHRGQTSEKQASKIAQTERRIERMEVVEEPRKEWELRMSIAAAPRSGDGRRRPCDGAVVRRGDFTLGPVSLQLDYADRVAITGAERRGQDDAARAAARPPRARRGAGGAGLGRRRGGGRPGAEPARQHAALLDVLSREPELDRWPTAEVRTLLAKFGLGSEHVHRGADTLSPGERTRAALALLQARGVNLLVLDEPTNHLDLAAIEQLESALAAFEGTLLLVSHDRRLLAARRHHAALARRRRPGHRGGRARAARLSPVTRGSPPAGQGVPYVPIDARRRPAARRPRPGRHRVRHRRPRPAAGLGAPAARRARGPGRRRGRRPAERGGRAGRGPGRAAGRRPGRRRLTRP